MSLRARHYDGSELRFARRWVVPNAARRIVRDAKNAASRIARHGDAEVIAEQVEQEADAADRDILDAMAEAYGDDDAEYDRDMLESDPVALAILNRTSRTPAAWSSLADDAIDPDWLDRILEDRVGRDPGRARAARTVKVPLKHET